jgi:heavy metal sensor kinase
MPRHRLRFGEDTETPHYYLIWENDEADGPSFRSNDAPDIDVPDIGMPVPESGVSRIRDGLRERILRTRNRNLILVGLDVSAELAAIRMQSTKLALAGGALLLAGLIVSHLLVRRALKPISEISDAATRIADGDLDERIETFQNRTELGRLGKVLNHTFDELENAYRRQSQFTADASHELRTPVAVILSEIQSAPKSTRSAEEYEECLTVCEESAISMQRLLQQLMALAQFDAGKGIVVQEPVDLQQLVEGCIQQIKPLAEEEGVVISQELGQAECNADADRLSQVVTNLLANAVAYSNERGEIDVSLRSEDGSVFIEISDNGIGIAEEDVPHIFERFYRADKSRSGEGGHSGLGLAICKEIVEAHRGDIAVESVLGEGSKFTVRLPA